MRPLSTAQPAERTPSVARATAAPTRPRAADLRARARRAPTQAIMLGRRLRPLADRPAVLAAGVLVLMALSAFLRSRAIGAGFWIDEGIAVGIASFPLTEIPTVLRQDGAPPLYYLMLSVWMGVVGSGEAETHALSLGFAILTVPAALWAGRSLFGARTGWMAAVIAALHPFLTYYAQETRMYALVALLTLLLGAVFVHAFVDRRRGYLPVFAVLLATLLYTHNWALFVAVGALAAVGPVWQASGDRRGLLRDAALGFGGAALLFAPWVPSLVFQVLNTGAPWATVPTFGELTSGVGFALGGTVSALILLLVGGVGFAAILQARGESDPSLRRRWTAALALLVLAAGAVLAAWLASQISPVWANRYMAVAAGPAILIAAIGLAHARRLGIVTLAILAVLWFEPRIGAIEGKDNTRQVTTSVQYRPVGEGDLVVSTHPERIPLLQYYMGEEFRYATSLGPVADPRVFDWRSSLERLEDARPTPTSDPLIESLRSGQALILVQPIIRTTSWRAPWTELVRRRAAQWEKVLDTDPRLRRSEALPEFGFKPLPRGIRTVIYRKR
ncbi:MAG TPA: glycosyltransferase family 39 protein [Solirubrobacteraceae bacterium]|nr:glycosyltransferase family 39 protein [Solirubrobacteraceae bacterium]